MAYRMQILLSLNMNININLSVDWYDDGTVQMGGTMGTDFPLGNQPQVGSYPFQWWEQNAWNGQTIYSKLTPTQIFTLQYGCQVRFQCPAFNVLVNIPPGNYAPGALPWVNTGIQYTGATQPGVYQPGGIITCGLDDIPLSCDTFATEAVVVLSGEDGYTDTITMAGLPVNMEESSGSVSGVFAPVVAAGAVTSIAVRANGGLLRAGTYRLMAMLGGTLTPIGQGVVAAVTAYTVLELLYTVGRSVLASPTAPPMQLEYQLPTPPACPTDYIPAQPLPQELNPVPPTLPKPREITPPDTPDPGDPAIPPGLDACCGYIGACINGIRKGLYDQNHHLDYVGECIDTRGAEINKTLQELLSIIKGMEENGVPVDEELKDILRDIAKSLIVGYDDPEGIKERIADICASFLNLIDSRRG